MSVSFDVRSTSQKRSVIRMKSGLILSVCLSMLLSAGCGDSPRKQGVGGGASAPVSVRLLYDEAPSTEVEAPESSEEKITTFGTLKGRVVVKGTKSQIAMLAEGGKLLRGAKHPSGKIEDQSILVSQDGGLANVYVYLSRIPNTEVPAASTEPVSLTLKDGRFEPRCSVVRVGQPLKVVNNDVLTPKLRASGVANKLLLNVPVGKEDVLESGFQFPERNPIWVASTSHKWLGTWTLPLDHPWVAITKPDGTFEITGVPAGQHEFIVWHEGLGRIENRFVVDIPENGSVEKTIDVSAARLLGQTW
ncbi:hypothetical protein [Planctomicrobium sp. SH527]|uniref:hypothetical protein n=1 Tax=Planctomicrobium sp. SH527 TaxID=3448123 RepID=UPI003F5AF4C7